MLLVFAVSATALLAMVGLLYSFGFVLAERRGVQTAADAASLSGAWQVLAELQSDDRSDAHVQSAVLRYASSNGFLDAGDVSFVYLRANGSTEPRSEPFPIDARGVRVTIAGQSTTFLPGFVGAASVLVQSSAGAIGRPTASPGPETLAVPIGINQSAYAAHAQIDLLSGARLDLRSAGAPDYGLTSTNLQFWSDGQDANGSLAVGSTLPIISGSYSDSLAAGLADNVRRQNLRDASGAQYGLLDIPIVITSSPTSVGVLGFARVKLRAVDISSASARGVFVPYPAGPYGTPASAAPDFGAVFVGITQ